MSHIPVYGGLYKSVRPGDEHPVPATKIPHNTMYVNRFLDVVVLKEGVLKVGRDHREVGLQNERRRT